MSKITENTVIPLSLVIVLIGGIFWLANLSSTVGATRDEITQLRQKQDDYDSDIKKVDERLSRIEGFMRINLNHERVEK